MIPSMRAGWEARPDTGSAFALVAMLTSFVVVAETGDLLRITPAYEAKQLVEEIYNDMDGWRMPPAYDSEWRAEEPQQEGRIRFGYDSAYEEMRARGYDSAMGGGSKFDEPVPSSQIRIRF